MSSKKQYGFVNLSSISSGETYNAIAVVKFAKSVRCSKGSGYIQTIGIIDPSLVNTADHFDCEKLICNIFSDSRAKLNIEAGDVLVMHRLKINKYKNAFQGLGIPSVGFSFGAFHSCDGKAKAKPNSDLRNVTSVDLLKVKELLAWRETLNSNLIDLNGSVETSVNEESGSNSSPQQTFVDISDIQLGKYFNLKVQVVRIIRLNSWPSCVIVRVWDGTKYGGIQPVNRCSHSDEALCLSPDFAPECQRNCPLEMQSFDCSVDVYVYDEHCETVKQLRPGMFTDLINVHFMMTKQGSFDLTLHGGNRYGRCIKAITPNPSIRNKISLSGLLSRTQISRTDLPVENISILDSNDRIDNGSASTSRPQSYEFHRLDCIVREMYPDIADSNYNIHSILSFFCPECNNNNPINCYSNSIFCDISRFCECQSSYTLVPSISFTLEDTEGWLVAHVVGCELGRLLGENLIRDWLISLSRSGRLEDNPSDNLIRNSILLLMNQRIDVCLQKRGDIFYIVDTKII